MVMEFLHNKTVLQYSPKQIKKTRAVFFFFKDDKSTEKAGTQEPRGRSN